MAQNKDSAGLSELASFSALKDFERRAVILKSEGKPHEVIANHINDQYALEYSHRTVQEWFTAKGKLYQALMEYNEAQAITSLTEARQLIKRASKVAASTLIKNLNSHDERVAQDAAKALLNKYIPDKQMMLDKSFKEEELPDELKSIADDLRDEDGSQPVDDAQVGSQDSQ